MRRFNGQWAVVTGGASGIGEAIVRRLAAEGARVLVLDIQSERSVALAAELTTAGAEVEAVSCDVADTASMRTAMGRATRLDVLVNCAGIAHIGTVETTTPEDLDRLYSVNVRGVYHGLHFGVPLMLRQGGGTIVNMASVAARVGVAERFAYSMTKGAVLAMTLSVARDYAASGLRCNAVCPARVHTPFVDGYLDRHYAGRKAEMFARLSDYQPIGRMGKPEEVAALVAFLCSSEGSFITGSAYDIDGGVTLLR